MRRNVLALGLVAFAATLTAPAVGAPGGAVPRCQTTQLRLSRGDYGEAATQFIQTFTFTNGSPRACGLMGWPSIRVRSKLGRMNATRFVRVVQGPSTAPPFRRVVLRPGGAASFDVYGADWNLPDNRPCPTTSAFHVTAPGERRALDVRVSVPNCGRLLIAPLVAGRRDRDSWSRVWKS